MWAVCHLQRKGREEGREAYCDANISTLIQLNQKTICLPLFSQIFWKILGKPKFWLERHLLTVILQLISQWVSEWTMISCISLKDITNPYIYDNWWKWKKSAKSEENAQNKEQDKAGKWARSPLWERNECGWSLISILRFSSPQIQLRSHRVAMMIVFLDVIRSHWLLPYLLVPADQH